MDKLEKIFEMQAAFNADLGARRGLENISADEWQQKLTLAMLSELAEALANTNFKWWKNQAPQDNAALREEIVDMLHFLVSMALRAGMSAQEFFDLYVKKNEENFARQRGLSQKPGYYMEESDS